MDGEFRAPSSSYGTVLVEQDGVFSLKVIEQLQKGDLTSWGEFRGVYNINNHDYYLFKKKLWSKTLESYETKKVLVATSSAVHPRATIHGNVIIEPRAVVGEFTEILEGAKVKAGTTLAPHTTFHHLMRNSLKSSTAS